MQPDLSQLCHTNRRGEENACLLSPLYSPLKKKKKKVRYDDLCESARFILADLAANSYVLNWETWSASVMSLY